MSKDYDYLLKTVIVGDGAVGKTALSIRFTEGSFKDDYKMTIGVNFSLKTIQVEGIRCKLQIWDTGGQEQFSYVRPSYYRGSLGDRPRSPVESGERYHPRMGSPPKPHGRDLQPRLYVLGIRFPLLDRSIQKALLHTDLSSPNK